MDESMEILFDAKDHKFNILEVPIVVRYDGVERYSEEPFSHGFKVIANTLKMVCERYPIRFFGYAGGLMIFVIPFAVLYSRIYQPVETGILPTGGMFVVATLGIIGTFLIFTGITLHGVKRMSGRILEMIMK